jgi:aminoglycoside/choline kinase family phosphotransferase
MSFSSNSSTAPVTADARLTLLKAWLTSLNLVAPDSARPASSDASFRRYIVLTSCLTILHCRRYTDRHGCAARARKRARLRQGGRPAESGRRVRARRSSRKTTENGFLLLLRPGHDHLDALNHDNASVLYAEALESLMKIQLASQPDVLPEFDRAFMLREMNLFPEWFIGKHLAPPDRRAANPAGQGLRSHHWPTYCRNSKCSCTATTIRAT